MRKLETVFSIKPCNPNKLIRDNRDKINELVDAIEKLERDSKNDNN